MRQPRMDNPDTDNSVHKTQNEDKQTKQKTPFCFDNLIMCLPMDVWKLSKKHLIERENKLF